MTKRINRNILISSIVGLLLLTAVSIAWGKGIAGVANTIHNLSSTASVVTFYESDNVDEVCVFCHTPHGGLLTGPLWNHSTPSASSFTHYNSVTLSTYLQGLSVSRDVNDESLLCMSCHDGSVAVDHLINDPNSLGGAPVTIFGGNTDVDIIDLFGTTPGSRIGASPSNLSGTGDLSDDHPISFSYDSVLADPMYNGGSKDGELQTVVNAVGSDVRFFGGTNRVECSSCHDPHVDYITAALNQADYAPFLIRPNTGSGLCLACHNK